MNINNHHIEIEHKNKMFFPCVGVTKGDVINYYNRIAPVMLPHISARPINLQCAPDGLEGTVFYQKKVPSHYPAWIDTVLVPLKQAGSQKQIMICNRESLVYVANQACLTPHSWLCKKDNLNNPDRMVFDLDLEEEGSFEKIKLIARHLQELLPYSYVMTTGSKGLHVVVPLNGQATFDEVRGRAKTIAAQVVQNCSQEATLEIRKNKRRGRVFVDYLRNAYGQTSVPPYAIRIRPGAPVATPIDWDELDRVSSSTHFTISNIFRRLGQKEDPWKEMGRHQQSLAGL